MPLAYAHIPPRAIRPGFTGRKPSEIPAATVSRPWGFGQFQLSFPVKPRRMPRSSGKVRVARKHPGGNERDRKRELGSLVVLLLAEQGGGWSLMIFCARATRGLRRPSLDARSGRSISLHP